VRRNESQRPEDKNVIGDEVDLDHVQACQALLDKVLTQNGALVGAHFAKVANSGKQ
jgi:hypothetical protein